MVSFSIIIPYPHDQHKLEASLNSIKKQTFTDYSVLLVGDDSCIFEYSNNEDQPGLSQINTVVDPQASSRHLARKIGTRHAVGTHFIYLNEGVSFEGSDSLAILAEKIETSNPAILSFDFKEKPSGERVCAYPGHTNEGCSLAPDKAIERVFGEYKCHRNLWQLSRRVINRLSAVAAFDLMDDKSLEAEEEAYEYTMLACLSTGEEITHRVTCLAYQNPTLTEDDDIWSIEQFNQYVEDVTNVSNHVLYFVENFDLDVDVAHLYQDRLMDKIGDAWDDHITMREKEQAAQILLELPTVGQTQLYRILAKHCRALINASDEPQLDFTTAEIARIARQPITIAHTNNNETIRLSTVRKQAEDLMTTLTASEKQDDATALPGYIFVSMHKPAEKFESSILTPIHVGAANAAKPLEGILADNTGDNISELNPQYCELTAQYWAWKNIDASYYGFCHYRRYFNFANERYHENRWGEIEEEYIDAETQKKYALDDSSINDLMKYYDVVTTENKDLRLFPGHTPTPLLQWQAAPQLNDADLLTALTVTTELYPDYAVDVDEYMLGNYSRFCNMFIMRKEIFFDYCEWLFPILEYFCKLTDMSTYSKETLRTPGHLSERLLNVYLNHQARLGAGLKTKELQCVRFDKTDVAEKLEPLTEEQTNGKPVIPVVFAADSNYVAMLTTTIYSMLTNASNDYHYDVVVLSSDITGERKRLMTQFLEQSGNATVRTLDVTPMIRSYKLTTNNPHISVETYYRFLIQDALPYYDKVVYLDSDLLIKDDISKLFQTELNGAYLAAVRDMVSAGRANTKGETHKQYLRDTLYLTNPFDYFQAGVLLLNTQALREHFPVTTWLEAAMDNKYIYNDQDILNEYCRGNVLLLSDDWNVMHECMNRIKNIFTQAPASIYDSFMDARKHERIIHYAGCVKPWNTVGCDRGELYWSYARQTPFYEELMTQLVAGAKTSPITKARLAVAENEHLDQVVRTILPPGTQRREKVKDLTRLAYRMSHR